MFGRPCDWPAPQWFCSSGRGGPCVTGGRTFGRGGFVCGIELTCFAAEQYTQLPYSKIRTVHPYYPIEFHPLYFYLHFSQSPSSTSNQSRRRSISAHLPTPSPSPSPSPSPPPPPSIPDAVSILLTHLPTFPECRYAQYGPLCTHPNASCAFATFPPVERLEFENGEGEVFMVVENPGGCTILDINRALAQL